MFLKEKTCHSFSAIFYSKVTILFSRLPWITFSKLTIDY